MGIVEETEEKLAALRLRLPDLEGKANKRERTQVNKEIYALENGEEYAAALKAQLEGGRAAAAADDDAAHAQKLKDEAAAEVARVAAAEAAAAAKAAAGPAVVDDGEVHMEVNKRQHGDGKTKPVVGDKVGVTYVGTFPDGVEYQGVDYSGKVFDTTATINAGKGKPKLDKPLTFTVGENKAIRGWEECVRTMTLGESCELTVGPKWAYRKGGILDEDKGVYVVPPNATLFFKLRLVQVGDKMAE